MSKKCVTIFISRVLFVQTKSVSMATNKLKLFRKKSSKYNNIFEFRTVVTKGNTCITKPKYFFVDQNEKSKTKSFIITVKNIYA